MTGRLSNAEPEGKLTFTDLRFLRIQSHNVDTLSRLDLYATHGRIDGNRLSRLLSCSHPWRLQLKNKCVSGSVLEGRTVS